MHDENALMLMALNRIKNIKGSDLKHIHSLFDNLSDIRNCSAEDFSQITGIKPAKSEEFFCNLSLYLKEAETQIENCIKNNIRHINFLDNDYPEHLLECSDFPPVLFYKGKKIFNSKKYLAIVGTRNADDYGKDLCKKLVRDLAKEIPDLCIVSGLALGIDVTAHKAALNNGLSTIAVMAGGLSYIYPRIHTSVAADICTTGTVMTEFYHYEPYYGINFLSRNRIIAGLSEAVVVVESAIKGGSLSTANLACSYNRDVYTFPGRVGDSYSEGCNLLIFQHKANLITSAKDLLYFTRWNCDNNADNTNNKAENEVSNELLATLSSEEKEIYEIVNKHKKVHKDMLILSSNNQNLDLLLINLEFKGILKCLPGNIYSVC